MKTISFSEFRKHASSLLDLVEDGETIEIRRHGQLIARVVPAEPSPLPSWKQPRERLVIPGASLSQTIIDERRSR